MTIDEVRAWYEQANQRELLLHTLYYLINSGAHMSALSDAVAAVSAAVNQAVANGDAVTVQAELAAVNSDVSAAVAALTDAASKLAAAFPVH